MKALYAKLTNICTTGSLVDPQMSGNLNVRVPRAQAAFVRDSPSENTTLSQLEGIITSAEREVKVSRRSGMYQSYNFSPRLQSL